MAPALARVIPDTVRASGPRLALVRSVVAPSTLAGYRRFWRRFTDYQIAHPGALEVQARGWLATLPVSQVVVARAALRHSLGDEALPWRKLANGRKYRRNELRLRETLLTPEDTVKLRAAATDPRERALIEVLWLLRRFEGGALQWLDVDFAQRLFRVQHGKGDEAAITVMPTPALEPLRAWYLASGSPAPDAFVFPGRKSGTSLCPGAISHIVTRLIRRAGLSRPGRGGHALRRTFASTYLRTHKDRLLPLSRLLRHKNVATTAKYVFLSVDDLREGMDDLTL